MTAQRKAVYGSWLSGSWQGKALPVVLVLLAPSTTVLSLGAAWAQTANPATKYTFTSFYPGGVAGVSGAALSIDNAGDVVGDYYVSSSGLWDGYERLADGTFNSVTNVSGKGTLPYGINSGGMIIVGIDLVSNPREMLSLLDTAKSYDWAGFLYQNGSFTQYEFQDHLTSIHGINDGAVFVGYWYEGSSYTGFISNGNTISYNGEPTVLNSINDNGVIVGSATGSAGDVGFEANTRGQITSTLQYPGASFTSANGINKQAVVVGMYASSGVGHGYIFKKGKYTTLPIPPGAVKNKFQYWGINDSGQLSGSYTDKNGQVWGFVATP